MRVLFAVLMTVVPAAAQSPLVRIVNTTHPSRKTFQIGDRFEVRLTGAPNQQVSVRTTMNGRTGWSPILGSTDSTGKWSSAGQFEKSDFGNWRELWTAGSRLATTTVQFFVDAPCVRGGLGAVSVSGTSMTKICKTAEGDQRFSTSSAPGDFGAADARPIPGHSSEQQAQDVYQMGVLQDLITGDQPFTGTPGLQGAIAGRGDETAELIANLIGANGLSAGEIRNVLMIVRAAFARPQDIAPGLNHPERSLTFVRHLADLTDDAGVQRQIAETVQYLQTR